MTYELTWRNNPEATTGELYGPAMEIVDPEDAQAYFDALVGWMMDYAIDEANKEPERAAAVVRSNLGYWAGYYTADTRARVERLFQCAHPVFGAIAVVGEPTPEQAFEAGKRIARESA